MAVKLTKLILRETSWRAWQREQSMTRDCSLLLTYMTSAKGWIFKVRVPLLQQLQLLTKITDYASILGFNPSLSTFRLDIIKFAKHLDLSYLFYVISQTASNYIQKFQEITQIQSFTHASLKTNLTIQLVSVTVIDEMQLVRQFFRTNIPASLNLIHPIYIKCTK